MVEMLQNISKHSDVYYDNKGCKSGIFIITESEEEYVLISGNYVLNAKVQLFENSIEHVNRLSHNELILEYNRILHRSYTKDKREGLGLLDMKRKSKKNLICNFYQMNKKLSFFTMQVIVKKKKT